MSVDHRIRTAVNGTARWCDNGPKPRRIVKRLARRRMSGGARFGRICGIGHLLPRRHLEHWGVVSAFLLAMAFSQPGCANRAFYWSERGTPELPTDSAYRASEVRIPIGDTFLVGWVLEPNDGIPLGTVVFCRGNGGTLNDHLKFVDFLPRHRFRALLFDYRGFGGSSSRQPTRESTASDVSAAIDYATTCWGQPWLMGHSLGASLAIVVAGARASDLRGVVVVDPFTSYRAMAQVWLSEQKGMLRPLAGPSSLLVSNGRDPIEAVAHISPTPLLIVHAADDELIPPRMSQELYEKAEQPKRLLIVPGAHHLSDWQSMGLEYVAEVVRFLSPER